MHLLLQKKKTTLILLEKNELMATTLVVVGNELICNDFFLTKSKLLVKMYIWQRHFKVVALSLFFFPTIMILLRKNKLMATTLVVVGNELIHNDFLPTKRKLLVKMYIWQRHFKVVALSFFSPTTIILLGKNELMATTLVVVGNELIRNDFFPTKSKLLVKMYIWQRHFKVVALSFFFFQR